MLHKLQLNFVAFEKSLSYAYKHEVAKQALRTGGQEHPLLTAGS